MNEHGFIRYVHSKLHPSLIVWKIHDKFQGGVPDAYYAGPAGDLWIEYKYIKALPKRPDTRISTCLTEQQKLWLSNLHANGRPCALVIGCQQQAVILQDQAWLSDISCKDFLRNSCTRLELIDWLHRKLLPPYAKAHYVKPSGLPVVTATKITARPSRTLRARRT